MGRLPLPQAVSLNELPTRELYQLELFYDRPRDTLYISLGGPRASIASELVGGLILIRYVPKTTVIVGATIPQLSRFEVPTLLPVMMALETMPETE